MIMENKTKISIIVPALNEEKNIAGAVENILIALPERDDYEILIFNDGSTDKTGEIANALAASNLRIKVIHHATPQNLGGCFKEGVELAQGEYSVMLPGDDETHPQTIKNIFQAVGSAEIITTYTVNKEARNWFRRFVSAIYTNTLNFLFCLNLRYFNGPSLIKTGLLKKVPIASNFAYMSAILVRLIKAGQNYKEIEMIIKPPKRQSRALKLKNVYLVLQTIFNLFIDVHFRRKKYEQHNS